MALIKLLEIRQTSIKHQLKVIMVLAIMGGVTATAGCAGPSLWEPMVQSNFAYPNSNILDRTKVPLDANGKLTGGAHAEGSDTRIYPFWDIPNFKDARQTQGAIDQALANGHGEILVDGSARERSTDFFLFWKVTVTVEGNVYSMHMLPRNLNNATIN